jgi:hypothetical protein
MAGPGRLQAHVTNDGIKEGADGYALLQRDLAEAVPDGQLDGDGVRRPLPRMFASAARLNFKFPNFLSCANAVGLPSHSV